MEFYIADEQVEVMTNSLDIECTIEERSTASFTVKDLNNKHNFVKGEQVEIYDGDLVFKGFVEISQKIPLTNTGQYVHQIDCTDMHYLADKRIVALAEENSTAGSIVGQIINRYLEAEGVSNTFKYWADFETQNWNEVIS